ncbi:MAG TPA: phosphatidate cytidylyltransferase [Vicinamibacterales bacterium]|nr:phosphatidate cytidylyltransferase [Vicinamibacterales bacterium]
MARVLSALVLLPLVVGAVWFLPPVATLVLASLAAVLAFVEYAAIAEALGARVPRSITGAAVLAACIVVGGTSVSVDLVLMSAVIVFGALAVASGAPGPASLRDASAATLAVVYIGLPLGALAAVRAFAGREAVLLLMLTIVISDSAQYYCGRAFGRRPLAPAISPKKTLEGAIGGMVFGTAAMTWGGLYVFPGAPLALLVLVSASIAALGMVGDLFESMLKRSAGIKDSSQLIPGHGGVLDRIDSWLFAAPLYYAFTRYLHF